jgi:uncharacterized protein (TIGR02145 family)
MKFKSMKIRVFIKPLTISVIILPLLAGCEKEEKIDPILFNTSITYGKLTDQNGNSYKTVTIGSQVWMAQNLRTTRFNDNATIPMVKDSIAWSMLSTPAYCWYENYNSSLQNIYGAFYNWYAVNTGKLCPAGWHVPSDQEWIALRTFLGGEELAGGKLKESGTSHWQSPNSGATNESGFTALPSGMRGIVGTGNQGKFDGRGTDCCWWSTTRLNAEPLSLIFGLWINTNYSRIFRREFYVSDGATVRCIKN